MSNPTLSADAFKRAQAIHLDNVKTRKRAFATITESIEDAVRRIKQRVTTQPAESNPNEEHEKDFALIARSMLNMACVYKDNENLYNENFQYKLKQLRAEALCKAAEKRELEAKLREPEYIHQLDNYRVQLTICQEALEDAKKRVKILEASIESMRMSDERMKSMRAEILKQHAV